MSRGTIVVSENPRGRFIEGDLAPDVAPKPGQCVSLSLQSADRGKYELAGNGQGNSKELVIVCEDSLQGGTVDDAYTAGSRFRGYIPLPGDEVQILFDDIAGTGDVLEIGDGIYINSLGKGYEESGTPERTPFVVLELVAGTPDEDRLVLCRYTGAPNV